jgi:hypothetical protein
MAPEAAAGQSVDKRSDVYSSCVVLAELLTGARLFTTASSLALTREQADAAPRLAGVEAPVAVVLGTGLHPHPDERPADGEMLLTRLDQAIEESRGRRWLAGAGLGAIGSTAATIAAGTTLTGTASAGTTTAATASKTATSTLSRGKVIAAAATAAAVIVAVIAFFLLRPTPSPPHQTVAQATTPPAAEAAATAQAAQSTIGGVYKIHMLTRECQSPFFPSDWDAGINQHGDTMTFINAPGTLNADGSFVAKDSNYTWRGVFATEGDRSVIRDGDVTLTVSSVSCHGTFTATKE